MLDNQSRGGVGLEPILREACSQAYPVSAICVQRFDDSLSSAIRITYRISLRSSSLWEPRHPLLKVVLDLANTEREEPGYVREHAAAPHTSLWLQVSCSKCSVVGRPGRTARAARPNLFSSIIKTGTQNKISQCRQAALTHLHVHHFTK